MMFTLESLILITGVLLLLGIASSKVSARIGVPVLVLFLLVGMLAGSEGIGGIAFDNYRAAYAIGTVALAFILFDGGLSTPISSVKAAWKPAAILATLGVIITAVVTGLAASYVLGIPWLEGLLLGSIVGSTDASAVFTVLRSGGVSISKRLAATLEVESGSNDPMAIFLTIGCLEILLQRVNHWSDLLWLLVSQLCLGAVIGIILGFLAVSAVNRISLEAAGLYPVLVSAFGLVTFGAAAVTGGSGFLAVYLAGMIIGNRKLVFQRGIRIVHDAVAWLSQIAMFIVLGLLSFPSRLLDVAWEGLLIAAVLIVLARPLAVVASILPFRYQWREVTFISWVGLKGAVPITLATFPLLENAPHAALMFDVVFFIVVASALIQGWSLPWFARKLSLEVPSETTAPVTLEISSLRDVDADIVDYSVGEHSRARGRQVRELALPPGVVIALVVREQSIIPPQGTTRLEAGDHVILVLSPNTRAVVNRIFAERGADVGTLSPLLEFPLRASVTVRELEGAYGVVLDAPPDATLDEVLRGRVSDGLQVGESVSFGPIALRVRSLTAQGVVDQIGLVIQPLREAAE